MKLFKELAALKRQVVNHAIRYAGYCHFGKLRAEGRLKIHRGGYITKSIDSKRGEKFVLQFPNYDGSTKSRPHFKGICQASNSGDVFIIAAWVNDNGTLRFEVCDNTGYTDKNSANAQAYI